MTTIEYSSKWPEAPYKGLNYYQQSDAALFCERDAEVRECSILMSRPSTKMLIVHGRTGTGKSSFIRAGLFPHYLCNNPAFFYLKEKFSSCSYSNLSDPVPAGTPREIISPLPTNTGTRNVGASKNEIEHDSSACAHGTVAPLLIRSTANPVKAIADVFRGKLNDDFGDFECLGSECRADALSFLDWEESTVPQIQSVQLVKCLQIITARLPGTLVVAVDQAEEIFTLSAEGADKKLAYFNLLEILCYEEFDIKLLIVLRTEYFGQFADHFRLPPDLKISTVQSGISQFMLQAIRERDRLVNVIERPTNKYPGKDLTDPFSAYRFSFESDLPSVIASDVLDHCGESSILPVLQLVCLDLYQKAKASGEIISFESYRSTGQVKGVLDRFVNESIETCLRAKEASTPKPRSVNLWKDVICTLVARQEGGALTSLLLPEEELEDLARSKELGVAREVLEAMAGEDVRLLRSIRLSDGAGQLRNYYSLGHDCLAPMLFQHHQFQFLTRKERTRTRRLKLLTACGTAAVTVTGVIWATQSFTNDVTRLSYVQKYVEAEPQLRLKLLSLVSAIDDVKLISRYFGGADDAIDLLRTTLQRAPVHSYSGVSAGIDRTGKKVVFITEGNKVVTRDLEQREAAIQNYSGFSGSPMYQAIGYVDGLERPVIYSRGTVFFFDDSEARSQNVQSLLGVDGPPPWPEISGGAIRLTQWSQGNSREQTLRFRDLYFQRSEHLFKRFVDDAEIAYTPKSYSWPIYSDSSQWFADMEGTAGEYPTITLSKRTQNSDDRLFAVSAGSAINLQASPFIRSIAFADNDRLLSMRISDRKFVVIGAGQQLEFLIPDDVPSAYKEVVRPQFPFLRPILGSRKIKDAYFFAWMTSGGVSVAKGIDNAAKFWVDQPLLADLPSVDSATKLVFSDDGSFLTLLQIRPGGSMVRTWDLSLNRRREIDMMNFEDLWRTACALLRGDLATKEISGAPHRLKGSELERPEFSGGQLCFR